MQETIAWAVVTNKGMPQDLYFTHPMNTVMQYWDDQWPDYAPHKIVELIVRPETASQ